MQTPSQTFMAVRLDTTGSVDRKPLEVVKKFSIVVTPGHRPHTLVNHLNHPLPLTLVYHDQGQSSYYNRPNRGDVFLVVQFEKTFPQPPSSKRRVRGPFKTASSVPYKCYHRYSGILVTRGCKR